MQQLFTENAKEVGNIPWNIYPRPQLKRKEWKNLNGEWDYISERNKEKILVPFPPESLLSGVKEKQEYGNRYHYIKQFKIPENWKDQRIILHFGAVNRDTDIVVNNHKVFYHDNGYLPFSIDIMDYLNKDGENELRVSYINDISTKYPWGKQKVDRGGMWYTPVSGIWQTVWIEPVPENYIKDLRIKTNKNKVTIFIEGIKDGKIILNEKEIPVINGKAEFILENPVYWTPENPHLYEFKVLAEDDEVESYFALRDLAIKEIGGKKRLLLNGKPYFFHGLLDQGYWSDGLYTPASPKAFEEDIMAMKNLGFNTLRKHIKIEPEQFYYDCDRLGMIVFQDMVNAGEYDYLRDTAFPTIGALNKKDKNLQKDEETRNNFIRSMDQTVRLLENHPSIVLWTIFNEGWGQFEADKAYSRLKKLDPTRFIDSTSGWFHQKESDVDSLHIYFKKLHLGKEDKAQLLSEFGGYSYKIPEHSFNLDETYGYRKYTEREEFVEGLRKLYLNEVLPLIPEGLNGSIYTQVSDVEDETNGLMTYDRKIQKIKPEEFVDVSEKINQLVEEI